MPAVFGGLTGEHIRVRLARNKSANHMVINYLAYGDFVTGQ